MCSALCYRLQVESFLHQVYQQCPQLADIPPNSPVTGLCFCFRSGRFYHNIQTCQVSHNFRESAMCCLQKTSAGMQLGYKSVLFILHFHLAGMNRGEPERTVAPPWRIGKNRSVTGVLPAWTWVNRGEPAREPG